MVSLKERNNKTMDSSIHSGNQNGERKTVRQDFHDILQALSFFLAGTFLSEILSDPNVTKNLSGRTMTAIRYTSDSFLVIGAILALISILVLVSIPIISKKLGVIRDNINNILNFLLLLTTLCAVMKTGFSTNLTLTIVIFYLVFISFIGSSFQILKPRLKTHIRSLSGISQMIVSLGLSILWLRFAGWLFEVNLPHEFYLLIAGAILFVAGSVCWVANFVIKHVRSKSHHEDKPAQKQPEESTSPASSVVLVDEPIRVGEQDRLNRRQFAEHFAETLISYNDPSCLITALYGPWGSGKSSMLNLIESYLHNKSSSTDNYIVIRFNPWNISNLDQLIAMFFHELKVAIKGDTVLNRNSDDVVKLLNLFSGILSVGKLSPMGSQYFSQGSEVTNRISDTIKKAADKPIDDIKKELDDLLAKTAKRIFILIDDIDRLDQQSAKLLFRMIRLNADFKNTTYVLSFDPKIVEQLLKEEQPGYGKQYIEKIIQLPIDIPVIDNSLLVEILVGELNNRIIKNDADRFDERLWRELVTSGEFFRYFTTIRDVVRYLNGLTLNYSIRASDVNMVDFMALEAIRTFASDSYDSIRRNKAILTRLNSSGSLLDTGENVEETKKILSEIFHIEQTSARQSNEIGRLGETAKATCRVLFPQLDRVYSNYDHTTSFKTKWRQEKRICSDEIFDNYFLVGVPKGEISDQEMRSILARSDNHSRFIDALNEIFDRNLGTRFLSRAEDYLDYIQSIYETISALFEIEDRILSEQRKMLALGADTTTCWLICLLLKREESANRKQDISKAIVASNKLYLPVYFVSFISPDEAEAGSENRISRDLGFSDADLHELQVACVAKIKEFAESGKLSKSPHLGLILSRWLIWGTSEEARVYANKLAETDEGVVDLLVGLAGEVLSDGGKRGVIIDKKNISKFVDVKVIEERVNNNIKPKMEQLMQRQKEAVEAFLAGRTIFDD